MSKKNLRKLKCLTECIEPDNNVVHPVTFSYSQNKEKNDICAVNNFGSGLIADYDFCVKSNKIPNNEANINFMIPNLNIEMNTILSIYNVSDIDSLVEYIDTYNRNTNFNSINRIVNLWIKDNLIDLKKYNKALFKIIKEVIDHHLKLPEIEVNKELEKYIDYWLNKKDSNDFYFDLILDFKKYLSKKYGTK